MAAGRLPLDGCKAAAALEAAGVQVSKNPLYSHALSSRQARAAGRAWSTSCMTHPRLKLTPPTKKKLPRPGDRGTDEADESADSAP